MEHIGPVEKALQRRPGNIRIMRVEEDRLPELVVPGPEAPGPRSLMIIDEDAIRHHPDRHRLRSLQALGIDDGQIVG